MTLLGQCVCLHFDSDCKIALYRQCTDVHSPFPHTTQPASLSLPYSNVWLCTATWKATSVKEIDYHRLLFKCLIFPLLYCHLSVQIPCRFLSIALLVFCLWVVGTPDIVRKLPLCAICCNFSLCAIYLLNTFMAFFFFLPCRKMFIFVIKFIKFL